MIDEQSGYIAENKAVGRLKRHFTITKEGLAQFRHAGAALCPGGSAKRRGHEQLIDEQSWYVTENKSVERSTRHFTITKQDGAACARAQFYHAGAALGSSDRTRHLGQERLIDEQSWHVAENNMVEQFGLAVLPSPRGSSRAHQRLGHFAIPKQSRAALSAQSGLSGMAKKIERSSRLP